MRLRRHSGVTTSLCMQSVRSFTRMPKLGGNASGLEFSTQ